MSLRWKKRCTIVESDMRKLPEKAKAMGLPKPDISVSLLIDVEWVGVWYLLLTSCRLGYYFAGPHTVYDAQFCRLEKLSCTKH